MSAPKRKPDATEPLSLAIVEEKLMNGHYDRLLDEFQAQLDAATAELRRCYAAMKAENTLVS
jgi:hypothetical protein